MKILIDLSTSGRSKNNYYHGGNEYANAFLDRLLNTNVGDDTTIFLEIKNKSDLIDGISQKILNSNNFVLFEKQNNEIISGIDFFDLYYNPLGHQIKNVPLKKFKNIILTIHGLRNLETFSDINEYYLESKVKFILKHLFRNSYRKYVRNKFLETASMDIKTLFVVPSMHTKFSLISQLQIEPDRIKVLYSPLKLSATLPKNDSKKLEEMGIKKKSYFLLVSSKRWIKNTFRAIKAFDNLIDKGLYGQLRIILTGADDNVNKLIKNKNSFITMDYVDSDTLEILYKNAFCFVYPSLNEGFGYPPLEAMKYGIPVICSLTTSLVELYADAVIGFNPFSIIELETRILMLMHDNHIYDTYSDKSLMKYKSITLQQEKDLDSLINLVLQH